jgi:hypothetical protein
VGEGSIFTLKLPAEAQPSAFDFEEQNPQKQAHDEAARASENPAETPPENDVENDAPEGARVA